ncbi:ribosomal protein L18e/L15P [Phlyctochytrium arcticum]|nr:ribosomal protein L18e/L15P [Phlyctochytrium arcticum]
MLGLGVRQQPVLSCLWKLRGLNGHSVRCQPIFRTTPVASLATIVQRPPNFFHLTNVTDRSGAKKKRKILGRGEGGKGGTSGRGLKGWHARNHKSRPTPGFEGGQSGILSAIPKLGARGVAKPRHARLCLDTMQHFVDTGKLDASKKITIKEMADSKCIGNVLDGVVLLAKGGEFFKTKVDLEVTRASQRAIQLVEQNGGTVTIVHHGKLGLKALLNPEKWALPPRTAVSNTHIS